MAHTVYEQLLSVSSMVTGAYKSGAPGGADPANAV
jgi:hypothetical protein